MIQNGYVKKSQKEKSMKKLFVCLCAGILLAGCGSDAPAEKTQKTCTVNIQGVAASIVMDAEGDKVTNAGFNFEMPYETFGVTKEQLDDMGEDLTKPMSDQMLKAMNLKEEDGWKVNTETTEEALVVKVTGEGGLLEKTFGATSLDEMITAAEKQDFECK